MGAVGSVSVSAQALMQCLSDGLAVPQLEADDRPGHNPVVGATQSTERPPSALLGRSAKSSATAPSAAAEDMSPFNRLAQASGIDLGAKIKINVRYQ